MAMPPAAASRALGRRALRIAVALMPLVHAACSELTDLEPSGHVDREVTFTLQDAEGRTFEPRIDTLIVYDWTSNDPSKRTVVWEISGSQSAKVITYGQVPPGLAAQVPALPLTRGSKYHVVAVGSGRFAGGSASAQFRVDADGTVVKTSAPVRGPRPSDSDLRWLGRHGQKALDALMPVGDPVVQFSYRSHRDLHHGVVERYFSIRFALAAEGGLSPGDLRAIVVAPIGRSIQQQLLDLHMKDRAASYETVLSRVSIRRTTLGAKTCQAVQDRLDALSGVQMQVQTDVLYLHPILHRIAIDVASGRIDATLYDDRDPLVRWATETHEALLKCAG